SGTSCVAGVLESLGVPMGKSWIGPQPGNPKGLFEDRLLRVIANASVHENMDERRKNTHEDRVRLFREWLARRMNDGAVIGGKYPALSVLVKEMAEAIPALRIIVPERPAIECARSWHERNPQSNIDRRCQIIQEAMNYRDAALDNLSVPVLRINYAEMTRRPKWAISQITEFCELLPSQQQIAAAIAFIDQKLNHHSRTPDMAKGAGTHLHEMIDKVGIKAGGCGGCEGLMKEMDDKGPAWCRANIKIICGKVHTNARKNNDWRVRVANFLQDTTGMPVADWPIRRMVGHAIALAEADIEAEKKAAQ